MPLLYHGCISMAQEFKPVNKVSQFLSEDCQNLCARLTCCWCMCYAECDQTVPPMSLPSPSSDMPTMSVKTEPKHPV